MEPWPPGSRAHVLAATLCAAMSPPFPTPPLAYTSRRDCVSSSLIFPSSAALVPLCFLPPQGLQTPCSTCHPPTGPSGESVPTARPFLWPQRKERSGSQDKIRTRTRRQTAVCDSGGRLADGRFSHDTTALSGVLSPGMRTTGWEDAQRKQL